MREAEKLFGETPLVWQTGSGRYAAAYRHHGEARRIRPIPGLPIDLLGGGMIIAPGSMGAREPYRIIRGSLDDFDRLPVARMPPEIANSNEPQPSSRILEGTRNGELFRYCHCIVPFCDDIDQLIDAAATWAERNLDPRPPIDAPEIRKTCKSVWTFREGRKQIGHSIVTAEQYAALSADLELVGFLAVLRAENGPRATFMIADGWAAAKGWPRRTVPRCRQKLIDLGIIERVSAPGDGSAAFYRWAVPPDFTDEKQTYQNW